MRRKTCISCAIFSKKVKGEKKMRTKGVPLIPRAGSVAMGTFNSRVEKKADRKPRVVNIRKVLATSGIVRGEVKRVKAEPVTVKEPPKEYANNQELNQPKMTETELRMADYLQAAEKVVNPPEEEKEEEPTKSVVPPGLGISIEEPKHALISEERMSRRKRRKMKREAMLKAREESMTVETA